MKNKEVYLKSIKDLEFASLLRSKGFSLQEVQWEDGVAHFVFEDNDLAADEMINNYINGQVTGDLRRFKEAEKSLRQMIYNHDGR